MRKFTLAWAYLASCAGRRVNSASQEQRSTVVVAELDQRDSSVHGELNGLASLLLKHQASCAFALSRCPRSSLQRFRRGTSTMQEGPPEPSGEWELDFYSRPVLGATGKKLWELLITDSVGSFYHAESVPSNCVNSRELRQRVQKLIRDSEVKPEKIRYFRPQMKNMVSIALNDIQDVSNRPSRTTYALYDFIQARERDVWSQMAGYREVRSDTSVLNMDSLNMPNFLKPQRFLFVTLPLYQFLPGGSLASGPEVAVRNLCPLPQQVTQLPPDTAVPGIIWYSQKSRALAAALECTINGMEISGVKVVPEIREMHLQAGLDTNWLAAKFSDEELYRQALDFEGGKEAVGGLHFLSIREFPLSGPNALYQGFLGPFDKLVDSFFREEPLQIITTDNRDFDAETQSLTRPNPDYPTGIWSFRDP